MPKFSLAKMNKLSTPWQNPREWQIYLEFIDGYFKHRRIKNPLIVELGTYDNRQKKFYEEFLGYTHIGIEIDPERKGDIIGDSKNLAIVNMLKEKLDGREVNILFIDGDHRYEGVKKDYELYSPLVKNLIVIHDIILSDCKNTVGRFWNELQQENRETKNRTFITIASWLKTSYIGHTDDGKFGQGIGIIKLDDEK